MNKKIDINKLEIKIPFSVPSGYFEDLKFEIQNQSMREEKESSFYFFKIHFLVPSFGILLFFIVLFNNVENINPKAELFENNFSDEYLYEYIILQEEDDKFLAEIDYLLIDYLLENNND